MSTTESAPLLKTHRIVLDPTKRQCREFARNCGVARAAYNFAVEKIRNVPQGEKWPSAFDISNQWTQYKREHQEDKPWLNKAHAWGVQQAIIMRFGDALKNFREKRARFPKFHTKKQGRDSYCIAAKSIGLRWERRGKRGRVKVPKIGWVRMREALRFAGPIHCATISRTADRWYISITVDVTETEPPLLPNNGPAVGIDVGLKVLAVLGAEDRQVPPYALANLRPLQQSLRKLRRLNKAIARSRNIHGKQCRSKRRDRLYRQRARLYARITFRRQEMHHQATTAITKQYGLIGVEDLQVKGLIRNKKLARHIADVGWGEFLRQLEYKAAWYGSAVVKAAWSYPSTQTCSACGVRRQGAEKLSLQERRFVCPQCGWLCDRDVNAAINLRNYALTKVAHRLGETQNGHGALTNLDAGVVETPLPAPRGKRDEVSTARPAVPAEYAPGVPPVRARRSVVVTVLLFGLIGTPGACAEVGTMNSYTHTDIGGCPACVRRSVLQVGERGNRVGVPCVCAEVGPAQ